MRGVVCVLLIGHLFLGVNQAEARQWASRDGRFTAEAELLTVEGDQAVLRREGGIVVRVPLQQLSLADVKYVQEALEAAGLWNPANWAPAASDRPVPGPMGAEAPEDSLPATPIEPEGPPLAEPGRVQWQAAPELQWLADRSGWLLSGVALVDRESGKFVWQDESMLRGFGDSIVTPEGTKIRRSPSPAQLKPPAKTARALTGGAKQAS